MVGVARGAEARDLGQHRGAALERMLQRLQHHRARALARHESRAAHVERQGGLRRILGLRQRAEVREPGQADGRHGLLRAAGQRRVDVAVADVAHGRADGVRAGGAGGDHVQAFAAQPVADGEVARRDVADHRGNEQRAHALRALLGQGEEAALQLVDAADAGAEHARDARGVLGLEVQAGDCASASSEATMAYCTKRSNRRASFFVMPCSVASKSRTSAAMCTS